MPVQAGAEPFTFAGGRVGAVLCHGLTGNPSAVRPWGEALAAGGLTVYGPRLPGHGTHWRELNRTRWPDWYAELARAFDEVRQRCEIVFAMGLSMGGTLALRLAAERGSQVAGLVLVNPTLATERWDARLLPVVCRLVPSLTGIGDDIAKPGVSERAYDRLPLRAAESLRQLWRVVRADLGRVDQPLLMLRSRTDHIVSPVSGRLLLAGVASTEVTERVLDSSYHVATLDYDAPEIFAASLDFVRAHSAVSPAGP